MSRSALIKHHRADISKSEKRSTTRCELLPHFFPSLFDHPCRSIPRFELFPPSIQKILPDFSMYTRTKERERERKRNFRNCRNAINSVAGYRGYRGLRRKFRTQQPTLPLFLFDLSSSLSLHFLFPPSPFSGEAHRRDRHTTGYIGIRRGYGEHRTEISRRGRGTRTKDEQHEDGRISRTYIPAAYQWWTLTTGVRSWRLAMVAMTGHIRGGIGELPR